MRRLAAAPHRAPRGQCLQCFHFQGAQAAFVCGAQVTALNLTAGAAGPLLDVAFVDTRLSDQNFRTLSRYLVYGIGLVYVFKAATL